MPNLTIVGAQPYKCPACGEEHTTHVTLQDVRRGYALHHCPDRGGPWNTVKIARQPARPMREPANDFGNYPDSLDVEAAGLF